MWIKTMARQVAKLFATMLLAALLAATLARFAPGFDVDEQQLDSQLSAESHEALRQAHAGDANILQFYGRYLGGLLRGDLGTSRALQRPVRELLRERLPVTVMLVAAGMAAAWLALIAAAFLGTLTGVRFADSLTGASAGILLCIPSAVIALATVYARAPAALAVAAVVFARMAPYCRNLLSNCYAQPHCIAARARGAKPLRILCLHVVPVIGADLLAVIGTSASVALGAAVVIESICGVPGIGQLAWQSALGRDLPVLVNLTMLITAVVLVSNSGAELAGRALRRQTA